MTSLDTRIDVSRAVTARRMLLLETHSLTDCFERVYDRTIQDLRVLAASPPPVLSCFHSRRYTLPCCAGRRTIVHLIAPLRRALYLGTVLDRKAAEDTWAWLLTTYAHHKLTRVVRRLRAAGPQTLRYEWSGCMLPTSQASLTVRALTRAVKVYLRRVAPPLHNVPLQWESARHGEALERSILAFAKKSARLSPEEDAWRILKEEVRCIS